MAGQALPWHQREDESNEAYNRFSFYRNLGPGRSLDLAYRAALADVGEVTEGKERAPGQWRRDSGAFDWVERAGAWDRHLVRAHGQDAAIALVSAIRLATEKTVQAVNRLEGPQNWAEVLESLHVLCSLFSPEEIRAVLSGGVAVRGQAGREEPQGLPVSSG